MASIRVTPIGFESFGVRSMCTHVKTPDVDVLIDAGVALGPRFGKLPHPEEYRARNLCRASIKSHAAESDVVVVSHYHNDHHTPNYKETVWLGCSPEESAQVYQDRVVIAKDSRNEINFSQRRRGWMFQKFVKKIAERYEVADGRIFEYGGTKLKMSKPVPHGEETSGLGWVIMTTIESGEEKIMHTSDVQGPMSTATLKIIMKEKPDLLILGGPPLYLQETRVDKVFIRKAIENAARIACSVPVMIFDHHVLRSEDWFENVKVVYDESSKAKNRTVTASEYAGVKPQLLECVRPRLYADSPPNEAFIKWVALPREKQRLTDPPI